MKKIKLFSMSLIASLLVMGCNNQANNSTSTNSEKSSEAASENTSTTPSNESVAPSTEESVTPSTEESTTPSVEESESESAAEVNQAPTITLADEFKQVEVEVGDSIDLFAGLSANDPEEGNLTNLITIDDDGGFDIDTVGTYTIRFIVEDSNGNQATVNKVVVVKGLQPGFVLTLNASNNKWQASELNPLANGSQMLILEKNFVNIDSDHTFEEIPTGLMLVHNTKTDGSVVVNVPGGYGEAAVITKNGIVIEGRDGANGKIVNEKYPDRINNAGPLTPAEYGLNITVPAEGYLLIAPNNGGAFDKDGREFLANTVIIKYGTAVELTRENSSDNPLTVYVNQAPLVSGVSDVSITAGDEWNDEIALATLTQGLSVRDDNGTFITSDDVTLTNPEFTVTAPEGFNANVVGNYEFTLTVADDEGATRTFTRVLKVVPNDAAKIIAGANSYAPVQYTVNPETYSPTVNDIIIYNNKFTGELPACGYSIVSVLKVTSIDGLVLTSKVVETRDGTSGWYISENTGHTAGECYSNFTAGTQIKLDATKPLAEVSDAEKGITYPALTIASLADDEFIMVCPNGYANNVSRTWANSNLREYDKEIVTYNMRAIAIPEFVANNVSYRPEAVEINPETYVVGAKNTIKIYTEGSAAPKLGWGVIALVDANTHQIVEKRDWTYRITLDSEGNQVKVSGTTAGDICGAGSDATAVPAITTVPEGYILVIFPNENSNPANGSRAFGVNNVIVGETLEFIDIYLG